MLATSLVALVVQVLFQFIAGWYLSRAYVADPAVAHAKMQAILSGPLHAFVAGFHYWGSLILILHSFLHLAAMLFAAWYRPPHHWRWIASLAIFGCAFLFQVTGNLLPFDKHGVQTAAVEGGIAAGMPVMGPQVASIIMGGESSFTDATLGAWYLAHRLLIPLALVLGVLGALIVHFGRRDIRENRILIWVPLLVPIVLALTIATPLGAAATAEDYNKFGAQVSWYTWPLHGSLEAFSKLGPSLGWIGTGVVPGLFVGFLVLLPLISKKVAHSGVKIVFGVFLLFFVGTGLIFGGSFAPLTGTRDPIVAQAPPDNGPKTTAVTIDAALAAKGREYFNNEGCAGCHGTDGKKAAGGPVLDNIHKEHSDIEWYVAFIKEPKSKKPGSTMPGFPDLGDEKLKAMAEFLRGPH